MISNSIQQVIDWLRARRIVNLVLVLVYFLLLLNLHKTLAQLSVDFEHRISIETYNTLIEVIYVVFLVLVIGVVWKHFKPNGDDNMLKLTCLSLTILFIFIHSRFMFDSNIEVIHSFEFIFLVFLIFPLVNRFGAAIFFTLPFMLFDEWYQYAIIYPYLDYFDLNDIMMDTYGCGLAISTLMIIGIKGVQPIKPFWKRPEFLSLVSLLLLVLIAVKICLIAPYASDQCSNTLLTMNERTTPEPFLRPHPTHQIMFHVMKPLEALVAITTLHLFYFGLDSLRKNPA